MKRRIWYLIRSHLGPYSTTNPSIIEVSMDQLVKIRQYSCKESLKISVVAKFESDLWKTNLDIALQSCEILFAWWGTS